jgi:hypothetical protein
MTYPLFDILAVCHVDGLMGCRERDWEVTGDNVEVLLGGSEFPVLDLA